jgi:hypothetical protein
LPPPDFLPTAEIAASLNVDDVVAAAMSQYRAAAWHVQHIDECCGFDRGRARQLRWFAGRARDALTAWIHNHTRDCLRSRPLTEQELDIYLADAAAYPAGICVGCNGPLPLSPACRVDGTWRRRIVHLAECPGCGCREFRVSDTAFYDFGPLPTIANPEARNGQPVQQQRPEQQPTTPTTARATRAEQPAVTIEDDPTFGLYAFGTPRPRTPDRPRY